ncbi:helix-turn-helix transcriptional regulator [Flavobacterium jumunjinense]
MLFLANIIAIFGIEEQLTITKIVKNNFIAKNRLDMNKIIGNKLKALRKEKGWSQEQASDYLSISQSAYARIENGASTSWANHVERICDIFQVTLEELVKTNNNLKESNIQNETAQKVQTVNQLSEKLIEQYEERIKELKEIIEVLKK